MIEQTIKTIYLLKQRQKNNLLAVTYTQLMRYLIYYQKKIITTMGGMCVSKQERLLNNQRKQKAIQAQRQRKYALNNGPYAQIARKYTVLYGCAVSDVIKQFIQNNYNRDYSSQSKSKGYPRTGNLTLTYYSSLIDRFETAHKNGNSTRNVEFTKLNQYNRSIQFKWQISGSGKAMYYDVQMFFDDYDKIKRAYFTQQQGPYNHDQWMRINRQHFPQPEIKPYQQPQSTNNNNYPSLYWNAHYSNQVAQSNQQFRQNMNKQAQQWTSYNQGKGWS